MVVPWGLAFWWRLGCVCKFYVCVKCMLVDAGRSKNTRKSNDIPKGYKILMNMLVLNNNLYKLYKMLWWIRWTTTNLLPPSWVPIFLCWWLCLAILLPEYWWMYWWWELRAKVVYFIRITLFNAKIKLVNREQIRDYLIPNRKLYDGLINSIIWNFLFLTVLDHWRYN